MKKSQIDPKPVYFERYIDTVDDVELAAAFEDSRRQLRSLDEKRLTALGDAVPAPGKWTIREIFQHLIDWERVLGYRALLYARIDGAVAQDLDTALMAEGLAAGRRSVAALIDELLLVRASTAALFASFDERMLMRRGTAWKYEISVLAVGFTIVGHQLHHLRIVEEQYYPLAR
ncbi:MAG: DinB family protein [Acidobacteria bacterium]|nr:DinB family protein [Acidobacteriota bacterium]